MKTAIPITLLLGYLFCDDPLPFIVIGTVLLGVGIWMGRRKWMRN